MDLNKNENLKDPWVSHLVSNFYFKLPNFEIKKLEFKNDLDVDMV